MGKSRSKLTALGLVLAMIAAACGGSDSTATDDDVAPATTAAPAATEPPPTEPPATTEAAAPETTAPATTQPAPTTLVPDTTAEWVTHETNDDCLCADGSEYTYFTRTVPDSTKVLLYFQGGGACFNEVMCQFGDDGTYLPNVTLAGDTPGNNSGIFNYDIEANPFADYSVVYMPYCTGDVHLGDATTPYSDDLTIEHNGFPNAMHGLDFITANHADATEVFVTGSSAGGVPAPLFAALAAEALPDAEVAALADASGGYPSNPAVNGVIGGLWNTEAAIPDWPELEGATAANFGIPDLFHLAGNHNPDIRFARYDNAWDSVQVSFSAFAGVGEEGLPAVLELNEQLVEGEGVDLPVYIAPGTDHTILTGDAMYSLEVEGVPFIEWLTSFVAGETPEDVRCVECEKPE